jgi:hypothetical protein
MKRLKQILFLELQMNNQTSQNHNKKKNQSKQEKEVQERNVSLLKKKISNHLYIDIDYDESTQIVYLILNRVSFAITLEEYAEFTINLNDAFNTLVQHPNILLALEKDEDTQEETRTFVYVDGQEDEFVN